MKIRGVGVVIVMLVFLCMSRGGLWVRFCVCVMYLLCAYILGSFKVTIILPLLCSLFVSLFFYW